MLATTSSSAGVYTAENIRDQRITAESTSVGAMVGYSSRGPIGIPTLAVDNTDFRKTFGLKDPIKNKAHYCAEAFLKKANRLYFTRVARETLYGSVMVFSDGNYSSTRHLGEGLEDPLSVAFDPNDIMLVYGRDQGTWNNDLWIEFFPNTDDDSGESFYFRVYEGNSTVPVEEFIVTCFRKVNEAGVQMYIEDRVNKKSSLVRVRFNTAHREFSNTRRPALINAIGGGIRDDVNNELNGSLTGGHDGKDITTGDIINAWDKYLDPESLTVNILINAGYSDPAVQLKMDTICKFRQDCISIIDLPSDLQETSMAVDYRRNILNLNSSHSAMYGPDLIIRDSINGVDVQIPPSGHVAAAYASTDENDNTWFAPAGIQNGTLDSVIGLTQTYKQGHRNALVESQVNVIRSMSGRGIVIWGADTLYTVKSSLQDVGVRRLLAMLHSSIQINNQYAVFRPIDTILFDRQKASLENILEPIRRGRGLYWYDVICDRRNNTNDTIANGDVIVDVYLDVTRYAKRIHISAVVPKTGQIESAVEFIDRN